MASEERDLSGVACGGGAASLPVLGNGGLLLRASSTRVTGMAVGARSVSPRGGAMSCASRGSWPGAGLGIGRVSMVTPRPMSVHFPSSGSAMQQSLTKSAEPSISHQVTQTCNLNKKLPSGNAMALRTVGTGSDVCTRSGTEYPGVPSPVRYNVFSVNGLQSTAVQDCARAGVRKGTHNSLIDLNTVPDVEDSTSRLFRSDEVIACEAANSTSYNNLVIHHHSYSEGTASNYDEDKTMKTSDNDMDNRRMNVDSGNTATNNGNTCNSDSSSSQTQQANNQHIASRNRTIKGPSFRQPIPGRKSALEQALRKFADRTTEYIIYPHVGMEFDSFEEAYDYYNLYSWESGFGIRVGKKRSSVSEKAKNVKNEKYVLSVELLCCCAGKPDGETAVSSRTNCPAMLRLHRTDDHGWYVSEHRPEHNHPLSETCGEKRHWKSHKHIDTYTKDLIRILRENNIGLTKIYSLLGDFFGSMQNVPTTRRTLRSLCQTISRDQAEDDIKKTLKLFAEMRESDPGFLYSVEPDDENRIKSLMWTNTRSRMQYAHFGDVITFDTTYRTNLYDMPFGMFIGVNNHFQSVLLGAVLLTEETIDSYKWVFKEFISLMGGKKPKTILTDQSRAMEVAIAEEWPGVSHRWCKWHVLRRVRECVGPKYTANKEFKQRFHKMLNEMLTEEEFKSAWKQLLAEYGMSNNPFLKQIYEVKEKWVSCYFRGIFCAKMTTTQRSESANHMLKNLVPPGCTIHQFVRQYAKLQHTIDDNENFEEKRTKLNSRNLTLGGPLVLHASKVYTFKVFELFCKLKTESEEYYVSRSTGTGEYVVEHYNLQKVQKWCKGVYVVKADPDMSMLHCECGMFEHSGLPCCHALRVMIYVGLKNIPDKMILQRWTKNARLILPAHLAQYGQQNSALLAKTFRHTALFIAALELVKLGDCNVECFHIAMACIMEAKAKLAEASKVKDGLGLADREAEFESTEEGNAPEASEERVRTDVDRFPLRAPQKRRERGRPTNARDRPAYERCTKRSRFCKQCNSSAHTSDRCPKRDPATVRPRAPPTCRGCGITGHTIAGCGSASRIAAVSEMM